MIDILVGLMALLLIFFLPGFFLVLILFPRRGQLSRDFDLLFKGALGMALSILIAILLAIILDQLGAMVDTPGINSVTLWISMISITVILGIVAWFFGGLRELTYSLLGRSSGTAVSSQEELRKLASEKKRLQQKLAMLESKEYQTDKSLSEEAAVRIPEIKIQISEINKKIDAILDKEDKPK